MSDSLVQKFNLPRKYIGSENNIWVEYSQLAERYNPIDLGMGFPNFQPPQHAIEALTEVANSQNGLLHQYTRKMGHPRLVSVLSKIYTRLLNRNIDQYTEIMTTVSATEALYASIFGFVEEGDEAIIIEPFFDCYEPLVKAAGGVCRFVALKLQDTKHLPSTADWVINREELEAAFNEKTKVFILNTPNNALGKVYSFDELELIADLCKKWNVLCIADEVFEWFVFPPNKLIKMATLPNMWERTITIGCASKTLGVTGWKLGWICCPSNLMNHLEVAHQTCTYISSTPIQEVIAIIYEKEFERFDNEDCHFFAFPKELKVKRDFLVEILQEIGMKPTIPEGCFFISTDWSSLAPYVDLSSESDQFNDYRFSKWLIKNIGIQTIPGSSFYTVSSKNLGENYIRFCFAKQDETLQKAGAILKQWKSSLNGHLKINSPKQAVNGFE